MAHALSIGDGGKTQISIHGQNSGTLAWRKGRLVKDELIMHQSWTNSHDLVLRLVSVPQRLHA